MLSFSYQVRAGQLTENQSAGVLQHSAQSVLVAYHFSSEIEGVSQTFLSYCQDQLENESLHTSLEFHQFLERLLQTAQRMDIECSFVGIGHLDEKMTLIAYRGSIILKRDKKIGRILFTDNALEIIEGKTHPGDVYVLLTGQDASVSEAIQSGLSKLSASSALNVFEHKEVEHILLGALEFSGGAAVVATLEEKYIPHHQEQRIAQTLPVSHTVEISSGGASEHLVTVAPTLHEHTTHVNHSVANSSSKAAFSPAQAIEMLRDMSTKVIAVATHLTHIIKAETTQLWSNDVYVRRKRRKTLGYVLIFAVVLIFTIIGTYAFLQNRRTQQTQEIAKVLQPFDVRLTSIKTQVEINPVIARQQTEELISELDILSKKNDQPKYVTAALTTELEKTREFYTSISGQEELTVLPTFFDLRLVQSNFLASAMDITPDTLFFLDAGQRKILALNIEKKQPTLLPIGEYPDLRAMVADEKYLYFLSQGLFRFTLSGTEVAKIVENPDDTILNGHSLGVFGSYVYVLNKPKNNIFRYTTNDDQLNSTPSAWVQPSQGVDFNTIQNFSIDSDVWMGSELGEIKKFTSGRENEFVVTGMKEPFVGPVTVFTKPDVENLYVLEPGMSRVVVLSKKGEFLKEVKSSTLAASTSVVANEKIGKIFALSGSLVFEIGL